MYTIKGEYGLMSNRKEELDNILDYFNIQVIKNFKYLFTKLNWYWYKVPGLKNVYKV